MYLLYTILSALLCFLILKWLKRRRYCMDVKRLDGKTVLITGGNSGIGKETAVLLALRGARVIIACRDEEKARKAVREIKARSHNMNVLYMEVDLANMRSIREFSKTFLQKEKRLDILINNAGMPSVLDWTDDDFSMCFGVNHLGHFLLTNLLLPRLKESSPSRVITLTCSSYKYQKLDFQDLNYNLFPFFTYCRSKLANIYFTQELAHMMEGKGVTAYAVHPGYVQSNWTCHYSVLFRILVQVVMFMFFVSCEAGAQTVVYCAVSDEVLPHNGGYFTDCRPAHLRAFARDSGVAKKLWEASERLVKLA
ncbi:retinol dehydrogenase 11-like [Sinocyclocheilus anshuiensis]|uniref:Retinol dehydrogenase 11-like n=1 Tax=Sinocyclocheilus anshuiensis TaxID=1608454 RepID=A0A671NC27_9TELE|nr:PREDICTED: retinol dehydrogenase 11-like [Sinocyclocheilus anshuiensis]